MNLVDHIARCTETYANLPIFRAFAEDRIPLARFPAFFVEEAMVTRFFQDLIWASTDIEGDDALAKFARQHRRVDSGHYKWTARDLEMVGLPPLTLETCFALETLGTRIQLARILACFHDADRDTRLTLLAALESAGAVTLGTLFGYVARHGLVEKLTYLGRAHLRIEERQAASIIAVAADLFARDDERLHAVIDTVFDALGRMFVDGAQRHYGDLLGGRDAA